MSRMLVVDFMHEFELGVWRTLFTHMVRVLRAASSAQNQLVAELDKRQESKTSIQSERLAHVFSSLLGSV